MMERMRFGFSITVFELGPPRWVLIFFLAFLFLTTAPAHVLAWPSDAQWIPVYKGGVFLQDPNGDAQGSRNIVSDPSNDAAFMYNDGQYIYFRLRLDQSPQGVGGQGFLKSFGWGVEIDTNLNNQDYEWLLMVDGISRTEAVQLQQNTVQGTLGDPSDNTETVCASIPISANHQITLANTSFNGDQDYFLEWRFPYDTFKQCTGLTDASPIRLFFGSSSSANSLTESGADLVGGSDLYTGFSDYVTPFGTRPATGTVRFVTDLVGNTDATLITAGENIFIRVDDADQDYDFTTLQTITVTITTPGGDTETVTLLETGVNTGTFTGLIPSSNAPPVVEDGSVQVTTPDELVTVTYIDLIDENLALNQPRTDTLTVMLPPVIAAAKTVDPGSGAAGSTVTYTIEITNSGLGEGYLIQVRDVLPAGFTYVGGSTSGLTTQDPTLNNQILTWEGTWVVPRQAGGVDGSLSLSFQAEAGSASGTYYNNVSVSGSNFTIVSTGDTAPVVIAAPLINIIKEVDKPSGNPGDELVYSVHFRNQGDGEARNLIIFDTVPADTTYVPGSLRLGDAASTYATAVPKTDAAADDEGEQSGGNVIFNITTVDPDDGNPNSGPDEGKVYFKVTID
jgi:uncharacterized repeat protein (TIGR01451 family)